ncbi:MAG: Clp protease N-terminal domain-containing protein, partial [Clostridia bacterium]|nr:Clp protease N-terminal domain-containing protein [Clostridia bacterium]
MNAMSSNAGLALLSAKKLAEKLGDKNVGTEYLLYGLSSAKGSVASRVLSYVGATMVQIENAIRQTKATTSGVVDSNLYFTPKVKRIISVADNIRTS